MNNDRVQSLHIPTMTEADFANFGVPALAFVKPVTDEVGAVNWSIHAADGTPMGLAPSRDIAFAAIKQHELEPVSVH